MKISVRFESQDVGKVAPGRTPLSGDRGDSGFTMIETIFAAVILTTLAATSVLTLVPISKQSRISREMETAAVAVGQIVEQIQLEQFNNITILYPPDTDVTLTSLSQGNINVNYVDTAADPLQIQITLSWQSPDLGAMSRTFWTARTQ